MKKIVKRVSTSVSHAAQAALRSQQIAWIASSHGVAGGLAAVGIEAGKRGLNFTGKGRPSVPFDSVFGKNLAQTLARLGPTFIKLGQLLATRPDLTGEPVAEELKILFDRVPPVPFGEIQSTLKKELGRKKIKEAFLSIDPKPLASASLSQTHRAVLKDGTPVILKVQKSGSADQVRTDLRILEGLVRPLHLLHSRWQLRQIFDDFREATLREVDYREEAKNIDRFQKNYSSFFSASDVVFPRYFPNLLTERVIALEPMHGTKMAELKKGSTIARVAASKSLAAVLEQIFDHGFFHADPHAGNIFFLEEEGRLGFIDLGLVGQLHTKDKRKFLKVLLCVLKKDRDQLAKALYELGTPGKKANFDKFENEVQNLLDDAKKQGLNNLRLDQMLNKLLVIAKRNDLMIPNRYILMIRSCLMIEGVAKALDPKISVVNVAIPIVAKSLMKTYNPLTLIKRIF